MTTNTRQQRLLERIQEDERLRGDLGGEAATALISWASDKVRAATDDAQRPEADVDAEVQRIRAAGREAAQSGESEPARVIALAEAALASAMEAEPAPLPAALIPPTITNTQQPASPTHLHETTLHRSWFGRVRRRWGERIRRWLN